MPGSNLTGPWGEALAAAYLRKKRYTLVACNYRCRFGEVDLIVQDRKYVVFVEVKLRKSARFASAMEYVDSRKQSLHPTEKQPRFDVIEIYAPEGLATRRPEIRHWEDAFQ